MAIEISMYSCVETLEHSFWIFFSRERELSVLEKAFMKSSFFEGFLSLMEVGVWHHSFGSAALSHSQLTWKGAICNRRSKWYMVQMSLGPWLGIWLSLYREWGDSFLLRSGLIIIVIIHGLWNGDLYVSQGSWCGQGCFRILPQHCSWRWWPNFRCKTTKYCIVWPSWTRGRHIQAYPFWFLVVLWMIQL